jgi:enoyl-CoA hydratase/carnithine racemase
MGSFETILYHDDDGVAWVTLNRPEVLNAYNRRMEDELSTVWREVMRDNSVRCVVLSASGERAFCVGVDRTETLTADMNDGVRPGYVTPWWFDDPGRRLGPKSNELWKPVIALVDGMACGGGFYLLGEADFIIASDRATFFDPHVTYGMTAAYEPINLIQKMPLQEVLRMSLLGAHERLSAQRAYDLGLVSQLVPPSDLVDAGRWAAEVIASAPPLVVQGTLRAIWMALEVPRSQAMDLGYLYTYIGTDPAAVAEQQRAFAGGRRVDWRLR